jgi:hypothetical protein
MAKTNRFCAGRQMRSGCGRRKMQFFQKKCVLAVDGPTASAILPARLKRDSRVARQWDWFSHILGLQIGTQFCPVLTIGNGLRDGRQGWVFLWAEICVNRWFFDIYIQGSKYNFKS